MRIGVTERFLYFCNKTSRCWEWKGGINSTVRGIFWMNGKTIKAHRASWIIHNGTIPNGMLVCHHCDNGKCVNPEHLFLGSYKDNTQDMLRKGRGNIPHGESHWNSKLTKYKVSKIRDLSKNGFSQKYLALMFNVSAPNISEVVNYKIWCHEK
jgi:hypothetical protein